MREDDKNSEATVPTPPSRHLAVDRRQLSKALALLMVGGPAVLAGGPALADQPVIGISFPNSSKIGAVITEIEGAKKKGAELGYKVVVDDPGSDINKQINTLKTWIQQRVAAIVCDALNPSVFEAVAREARAAGVKWIAYGEKLEGGDAVVGYAQYNDGRVLGEAAGTWIDQTLGGEAKVAILGYEKGTWGRLRGSGIEEGLKAKAPKAQVVAKQDAISNTEGLNVTRSILEANPDVTVILGVEDPATEGAYKAWIASGRDKADPKAFIGGMDGTVLALQLLRQGDTIYRASMAIPLVEVGEAMITTADDLVKGKKTEGRIVPLELVTPKSPKADEYLKAQGAQ